MAHYLFAGGEWALCQPLQGSCRGHMVSQIAVLDIKDCATAGVKEKKEKDTMGATTHIADFASLSKGCREKKKVPHQEFL